ncbi:hypothetical protein GCM10011578_068520 [Streptomyces fuscichromogenes]|uniref:Uncharacterized protein n=1 Tax=Streptomyces fuscichromogenes TaxID=1324013 RepID=A0A918CUQ8_9ACTN|nr:hypothetical protein GCM10011578_068520 [Streptomyces fuscichromogenes]
MLGALVVPTTIGPLSVVLLLENTPHPATRDMDATAAVLRSPRFRLNTRMLLDPPYQGSAADHTAAFCALKHPGNTGVDRMCYDDVVMVSCECRAAVRASFSSLL